MPSLSTVRAHVHVNEIHVAVHVVETKLLTYDNWMEMELAAAKLDDPAHALFHVDASWTIRLMLYFI